MSCAGRQPHHRTRCLADPGVGWPADPATSRHQVIPPTQPSPTRSAFLPTSDPRWPRSPARNACRLLTGRVEQDKHVCVRAFRGVVTLIAGLAGLMGCSKPSGPPEPTPAASASPSATLAAQPSAPAGAPTRIEVDGLTAELLPNGQVRVSGVDQWGGKLDSTYESAKFFRDALPVLSRSVTPPQAAALQKLADALPGVPRPAGSP